MALAAGIIFAVLLVLSVPVAYAMGLGISLALALDGSVPLLVVAQRMFAGTDSTTLLAVPFYILAGNLMETGGITERLVVLARRLVGHIRGSFGMTAVVAEYFFSGISGSTSADISAIGSMLIPAMRRVGYSAGHAVAIIAAATAMGSLVPPSIGMIVLAAIMEISVGALFVAGFLPAAAIALVLMGLIYVQARQLDLPVERRASARQVLEAFKDSALALIMPVIIFGGILGGVATATEAGAVACLYALIVGTLVYRSIGPRDLIQLVVKSTMLTGVVMFLVSAATVFSWILAAQQVPQRLGSLVFSISREPAVFIALTSVVFILVGALLEGVAAYLILVPIFYPLATAVGIHPLHFAIVVYTAVNVGLVLPPIGIGLLLSASLGGIGIEKAVRPFFPYLVALIAGFVLVAAFPWLTLVLPEAAGLLGNR